MDLKEAQSLDKDPCAHWYYISKGRAIKQLLGEKPIKALLDVGAGSGVFSKILTRDGLAARAVCVDPEYEDDFIGRRRTDKIDYVRAAETFDADTVLMIDVIEHVDDDIGLMRTYAERAAPGTRFVISAPAFGFLWSSHDEFLHHRRRYTLESLERAVAAAGLAPKRMRYFFGLIFPAAAAARMAKRALKAGAEKHESQLKPAPGWLNRTLVTLCDMERLALFPFNRIAGVTAFCLAEKPAPPLAESKNAA